MEQAANVVFTNIKYTENMEQAANVVFTNISYFSSIPKPSIFSVK